ncbi:NAD-dependent epimerase/dehydratase family protein [Roseimaritima ulvae]|uniref:3 beta-hydroxysteroid dehydrogenase/Delta 5-->4-isomerase n=1 Tax=Roseimaritima ulvae TaxID=980254 RepID=A0A5B9QRB0_9BACT|nr:NAD-dependent epimerase/dehydratase family protein [Roseimaritima ulvae]QEG40482.1 3 beta-hydroxysteroid dehydrogenase/Delta 5-->4-isomerase [Roseimaritima ulvae]
MNNAIVTGATGFIGTRLCEQLLAAGWRVSATVRKSSKVERLEELGVGLVPCDLASDGLPAETLRDTTAVFHLAGLTTSANLARLRAVNAAGTRRLAESIRDSGQSPTVVHVSSIAASGPAAKGQVRTADDEPHPISNYGRSKLEGEQAMAAIADEMPISIVRPSVVFGPGDREGFRIVKPIARSGMHFTPGWRTPPLSVIYVDDLAAILIAAADSGKRITKRFAEQPVGEGIYIAALDRHPSYDDWGRMIGQTLDKKTRVMRIPPRAAKVVGWCAGAMGSGSLHLDKIREAQVPSWAYYDNRLQTELGFTPSAPLEDQLAKTVQWYREQGWLKPAKSA